MTAMVTGWRRRALLAAFGVATVAGGLGAAATPAEAAVWIPGHHGPYGGWIPGHYAPGYGPGPVVVAPPHRVWVAGHYGPYGGFHPGHWAYVP
jgi:hypothetical protein